MKTIERKTGQTITLLIGQEILELSVDSIKSDKVKLSFSGSEMFDILKTEVEFEYD